MNNERFNLKKVIKVTTFLLVISCMVGCVVEINNPPTISVADSNSLSQEVFADNLIGRSDVVFTTTSAWTSNITFTNSSQISEAINTPAWISISPDHGTSAGNYTIRIALESNMTGADRIATITISCGDENIVINVLQKSIKEDGSIVLPNRNFEFIVYEINEKWQNGEADRFLSSNASITLYHLINSKYEIIDEILTNSNGKATYSSTMTDLFYTVTKDGKQQLYDYYIVAGLFTSQDEISSYSQYPNTGQIANPKPGWVKVVDIDGDGIINENDKTDLPYFSLKTNNAETIISREATIISPDYMPNSEINPEEISLEELMLIWSSLTKESQSIYNLIDTKFSSDFERAMLTPESPVLMEFWQKCYLEISRCNFILEKIEQSDNSDMYMDFKGEVMAYRALVYFYLNTMFGGVPLVTHFSSSIDILYPSRATWNEISDFINVNIEQSLQLLSNENEMTKLCYQIAALNVLQKQEYLQANYFLQKGIDNLSLSADVYPAYFLLTAESFLELGQNTQAAEFVNQVLISKGMATLTVVTTEEILNSIKTNFESVNLGIKYLNAFRWGETKTWGYLELLPIPRRELDTNPSMTQNPGW
ncbi:MAG: RagB/SusD family nutrient uptake outer membrane protein [Tannerella sp.]|jgi:hypothetical protein|nr:RagB/SusD family nutrient uptake outer membrane protein [Tannerella sp.]